MVLTLSQTLTLILKPNQNYMYPIVNPSFSTSSALIFSNFWPYMSKVMTKVTFFISRSKSLGKTKFWNAVKGLVTMNPHIKYEGPTSYDKEAIAKVKVYQI